MGASFPGRSSVDLLVRILCFRESSLRVPAHEGEMPRMPACFWPQSEITCVSIKRGRSVQAVGQPAVGERTQLGPGRRGHLCRLFVKRYFVCLKVFKTGGISLPVLTGAHRWMAFSV